MKFKSYKNNFDEYEWLDTEGFPALRKASNERVFTFERYKGVVQMVEQCDNCFGFDVDTKYIRQLAKELEAVAEALERGCSQ